MISIRRDAGPCVFIIGMHILAKTQALRLYTAYICTFKRSRGALWPYDFANIIATAVADMPAGQPFAVCQ